MKPAATPKAVVSSSPGRAEKLPAPGLAGLLRGKSGSRSRARSSPMFVSRSKSAGRSSSSLEPALAEGSEPSSPKVTCIGQVRIRKKNKNRSSSTTKTSPKSNRSDPSLRCPCLERSLLCKIFPRRAKKKKKPSRYCCRPYRFFFCWRSKQMSAEEPSAAEAAPPIAFVREIKVETESEEEEEEDEEDEETRVFVSSSSAGGVGGASAATHSPPKNALLLMRCGSAPHNRPSALALCRFPVSPMPASESEEEEVKGEGIKERGGDSCNLSSKDEEEESRCSSTSHQQLQRSPAGLMRCRSEPAKKAEKLMEVSYSKLNGSGGGSRDGGLRMVQEAGATPSPPPILRH